MDSYTAQVQGADTFVHLIGVPHPSPAKAKQFREIDLVSAQVAVQAARAAGIRHFIYLSVAQPARMMQAFIAVRSEGERMIRESGMNATFVRPWYVLGPGHRWAYVLLPFYWICERIPSTRESARRLGLVTISQMLDSLVWAVENPPDGVRILDVPKIRELGADEEAVSSRVAQTTRDLATAIPVCLRESDVINANGTARRKQFLLRLRGPTRMSAQLGMTSSCDVATRSERLEVLEQVSLFLGG